MNSHNDKHDQRLGHRRQPALGKAMPVTALLLNLNLAETNRASHARSAAANADEIENEPPPRYFNIADELQPPPSPNEHNTPEPPHYADQQLLGHAKADMPCLNCSQRTPEGLSGPGLAINEMCQRLCNDECRHGLCLSGRLATQDAEQLRQDFLKQYEIAEALAKTSAMTSTTQMKQRLAARKLEMEIETQAAGTQPAWLTTPSGEAAAAAVAAAAAAGDTLPPIADYESPPPRDLLLYLVR
nr:nocturnin isoform X6 [Drosophila virilis]